MVYFNRKQMESFGEPTKEQGELESTLLSLLKKEGKVQKLTNLEAGLSERRNEVLFQIATEIEDAENALRETEQLVQRLKKHLKQMKDLQRVLSK